MVAVAPPPATWTAMGTSVTVEVNGPAVLLDAARNRLGELERSWSRFRPESDVSRMNATRGVPVFVSPDTRLLVRHGVEAWRMTGGLCDPSVLDAVIAAGYDRCFSELAGPGSAAVGHGDTAPRSGVVAPGCAGIVVDDELGSVTLPPGVGFDPGAIGKGLAADLIAEWLLDQGADGAFVSIGGDIRMAGEPAVGDGWRVEVRTSPEHERVAALAMTAGAIATSTTARRRWSVGGEVCHHAIDPRTGRPAVTDVVTAAVVGGDAWWAEAMATELLLTRPEERPTLVGAGAALVVTRTGDVERLGVIEKYTR